MMYLRALFGLYRALLKMLGLSRMRVRFLLCLSFWPVSFISLPAVAQQLEVDLSQHLIALTTGFTGEEVVLFGSVDTAGDIVVVVRGPDESVVVRQKDKIGGLWLNRYQMVFEDVPNYYYIGANRAFSEIASSWLLERYDLGFDQLEFPLRLVPDMPLPDEERLDQFRQALVADRLEEGVYIEQDRGVRFVGRHLFRVEIPFPASVPTGQYNVTVYFFQEGEIISALNTPLLVSKLGMGAKLFLFAHLNAFFYGIAAVLVAVLFGWLADVMFRNRR